jgi:hypothetical protein
MFHYLFPNSSMAARTADLSQPAQKESRLMGLFPHPSAGQKRQSLTPAGKPHGLKARSLFRNRLGVTTLQV